jgi:hypothetical protein
MKMDNSGDDFTAVYNQAGSSGHVRTLSWVNGGSDTYWVTFDGVDYPGVSFANIPSC